MVLRCHAYSIITMAVLSRFDSKEHLLAIGVERQAEELDTEIISGTVGLLKEVAGLYDRNCVDALYERLLCGFQLYGRIGK